jgi:hypothetical protein
VLSGSAAAEPPDGARGAQPAVGTFSESPPVFTGGRTVGNVSFFEFSNTSVSTGTFTSTEPSIGQFSCMQVLASDTFHCRAKQIITGTIAGTTGTGTATTHVVLRCSFAELACQGTVVVLRGTGAMDGVRAVLHFESSLVTASGNYHGHVVVPH